MPTTPLFNRFDRTLLIVVFTMVVLCTAIPTSSTWGQGTDKTKADSSSDQDATVTYVCPPCGCSTCGTEFERPGTCADCGMVLVKKDSIRNVAIAIWNGVELLDFAGPGEVFAASRSSAGHAFRVFTVSLDSAPITSQGFVRVTPSYTLEECPNIDILVLPGGGVRRVTGNEEFMAALKKRIDEAEITLSVCTGAAILGEHGLLDNLDVTTFHGAIPSMQSTYPKARFHTDRRFIDNGNIITSAGVSAGIDSSLHVVSRLLGQESAKQTARYMEYDWRFGKESDQSRSEKSRN